MQVMVMVVAIVIVIVIVILLLIIIIIIIMIIMIIIIINSMIRNSVSILNIIVMTHMLASPSSSKERRCLRVAVCPRPGRQLGTTTLGVSENGD